MTEPHATGPVRDFIIEHCLHGQGGDELRSDTPLQGSGILDSITTLQLVDFLEQSYDIEIGSGDVPRLATLASIAELIAERRPG